MKALFFISALCLGLWSCDFSPTKENSTTFSLHGTILGKDSGTIVLSYGPYSNQVKDTVVINDGKFELRGTLSEPMQAMLETEGEPNRAVIFIEPTEMTISLENGKFDEFKMTGSKTQLEREELDEKLKPISDQINQSYNQLVPIRDSLKNVKDEAKREQLEKRSEMISQQMEKLEVRKQTIEMNFVRTHPKSIMSADLLFISDKRETIPLDSLKTIFMKLDEVVRNSLMGKIISEDIRKKENNKIGAIAPDFTFTDKDNHTHKLSDFKGKCVVLDFWASWCVPCRESFPHLKSVFQKYHNQGFEVIAISIDRSKDPWEKAIKEDQTETWNHTIIGSETNEPDVSKKYFFQGIPRQYLIDKNGIIAGQWEGYSEENEQDIDKKMKEIFGS